MDGTIINDIYEFMNTYVITVPNLKITTGVLSALGVGFGMYSIKLYREIFHADKGSFNDVSSGLEDTFNQH